MSGKMNGYAVPELLGEFIVEAVATLTENGEKKLADSDARMIREHTDHYCSYFQDLGLLDHGEVREAGCCENGCCLNVSIYLKMKDVGDAGVRVRVTTKSGPLKGELEVLYPVPHLGPEEPERGFDATIDGQKFNLN